MSRQFVGLLIGLYVAVAAAQSPPASRPEITEVPETIGIGDIVSVSVYASPELSGNYRVSATGEITLPIMLQGVNAEGQTPANLSNTIADALVTARLLRAPAVTVRMVEYHSRAVTVVGAVKKPLTFQASDRTTLLDALARAEGLTADAGTQVLVSRRGNTGGGPEETAVQRISVKGLFDSTDSRLNMLLVGGEEVRIPEAGKIYVVGNVRKPGAYKIGESVEATVLTALALSEGLLPYTAKQAFIYRQSGSAAKTEISVQLTSIMRRKQADVRLEAGDILYIPDSSGRRLAFSTLERLATFGSGTASGVLVWRR